MSSNQGFPSRFPQARQPLNLGPTPRFGSKNYYAEIQPYLFLGSVSCRRLEFLRDKKITLVVNGKSWNGQQNLYR